MMTDGAVDVARNTQQYGINWQLGEQTAINEQLGAGEVGRRPDLAAGLRHRHRHAAPNRRRSAT